MTGASFRLPALVPRFVPAIIAQQQDAADGLLREVLSSAAIEVDEGVDYDNWGAGTTGHLVRLGVPLDLYARISLDDRADLEHRILALLRDHVRVPREDVHAVAIEIGDDRPTAAPLPLPREQDTDLWGPRHEFLRLFISHKADDKLLAADLRTHLRALGVYGFVAHEDIEPASEWVREIERALRGMDALLAVVTPTFRDSLWTDQEVGAAIGRGVSIIPLRLGADPHGFMGRIQAVTGDRRFVRTMAEGVAGALLGPRGATSRAMKLALVCAMEASAHFDDSNSLMRVLECADGLPLDLVDRLEAAWDSNSQVSGAFRVQSKLHALLDRCRRR